MTPTHEDALYHAIMQAVTDLPNDSSLQAYPQLRTLFVSLSIGIQNAANIALAQQRTEYLYGLTPWAKLYKLQTGRDLELPQGIIKNLCPDMYVTPSPRKIRDIVTYTLRFHALTDDPVLGENVPHYLVFKNDPTHVAVDLDALSAVVTWVNNDMTMTFKDISSPKALISCPLFTEPFEVEVTAEYLDNTVVGPVYRELVGGDLIEESLRNDYAGSPAKLVMGHYYGNGHVPADDHPVKQLTHLLVNNMYTTRGKCTATSVMNGYAVTFGVDYNYAQQPGYPNHIISIVTVKPMSIENTLHQHLHDWSKNPLLVRDLLNNLDRMLVDMLIQHEHSMRDDPTAV